MLNVKLLRVIFAVLGILAIIFSIIIFSADVGSYESNKSYGGDAYTGMQNAAAQAANNVQAVGKMLRLGVGFVVMLHGLVLLASAACFKQSAGKTVAADVSVAAEHETENADYSVGTAE